LQRFYQTRLCRSVWRKVYPPFVWLAKIPIPSVPKTGFPPHNIGGQVRFASTRFWGISESLPQSTGLWYRFCFKKDLINLFEFISRCKQQGIQIQTFNVKHFLHERLIYSIANILSG
jgi:hypothetical protein